MAFKTKNPERYIKCFTIIFVALSLACAVAAAAKITSFTVSSGKVEARIERAVSVAGENKDQIKKYKDKYENLAVELKKKNLFAPPESAPKTNPVKTVEAVWGDEILINGGDKWYREGDIVQDAEIKKITPGQVTVSWNEEETFLHPFEVVVLDAPSTSKQGDNNRNRPDRAPENRRVERDRPERRPPGGMTPEEMRERRERFRNMNPEQRSEMIRQFRERRNNRPNSDNGRRERNFNSRENSRGGNR